MLDNMAVNFIPVWDESGKVIGLVPSRDFTTLDINDTTWSCDAVRDKILLVGFLGPEADDTYRIRDGKLKYSTWIMANCVRDILNGNFEKVE